MTKTRWNLKSLASPTALICAWTGVLVLSIGLYLSHHIQLEIFLSVLLAAVLAHTSSALIASATESALRDREEETTRRESFKVLGLLVHEVIDNLTLAKTIRTYLDEIQYMDQGKFLNRQQEPILRRFSLMARDAWKDLLPILHEETEMLEAIEALYGKFEYCNRLLEQTGTHIGNRIEFGDVANSYAKAFRASPWSHQLLAALAELEQNGEKTKEALIRKLETAAKT